MNEKKLTFIGAGNMSGSLIGGLIADGIPAELITVSDPSHEQLQHLKQAANIHVSTDNNQAIENADVVILAIKPQIMAAVAREISPQVQQSKPLIISIAAGIHSTDMDRWLGGNTAIVRCMPNTPALVQTGATALFANPLVDHIQHDLAESILRAVGLALWVEKEELLDAVTAVSGSGPAYFFLVIEAIQSAGESLGLAPETAKLLAVQTALGAAKMAIESEDSAAVLRQKVTSPGGTTEKALQVLEKGGLPALFMQALKSASDRSKQLAEQFGAES
ncbi:MAG: pyrroline-5-carboxylate reductase [Gammaproteobacteria bacterium]